MRQVVLSVLLVFGFSISAVGDDFNKGVIAFEKSDYATAMLLWEPLAISGDAAAQFNIGSLYYNGLGVTKDVETGIDWYLQSSEQGYQKAKKQIQVILVTADKLVRMGFHSNGMERLKPLADYGNPVAQTYLGTLYENGTGVGEDTSIAYDWYKRAVDQGYALAQTNLGNLYYTGRGVPHNIEQALKYFKLAAKQGEPNGQFNLGILHQNGEGVPQSYEEAIKYFKLAADQEHFQGLYGLDKLAGLAVSSFKNKDYKTGNQILEFLPESGGAETQIKLGFLYYDGKGVLQNYASARKWFTFAAEQGNVSAQYYVSFIYSMHVPQDLVYAYMWGDIAADNGFAKGNEVRDFVAQKMSPSQILKAQKLTGECVKKKYKGC